MFDPYEDELVWRCYASDELSVKSDYKLLQLGTFSPTINYLQIDFVDFYKTLWNLKLPSKIQITVWRIANNFLSSMANLCSKKLVANANCLRGQRGPESAEHVFWFNLVSIEV